MTAHAMHGTREKCLSHGMDGYLSKPINVAALWHELDALSPTLEPDKPADAPILCVANFTEVRSTVDNDRALFDELVSLYRADAPIQLAKLQAGLAVGDAQELRRAAHVLKGMMGVFSAQRCVAAAQAIENRADQPNCASAVNQLAQELDEFNLALSAYVW
jgi:HPt (histidine-containing phosphotransfer) domain-containing protein